MATTPCAAERTTRHQLRTPGQLGIRGQRLRQHVLRLLYAWLLLHAVFVASSASAVAPPVYPAKPQYAPQVRLLQYLKHKYVKGVRPNLNATKVIVDPAIYSVVDVDEARESLTMAQWFELTWTDDLLTWNPADFDGLSKIRLVQENIWIPDITIYQLLTINRPATAAESFVTVSHNGTVFLSRAENVGVHCGFEVASFPYDSQNCSLTYVAWSYPSSEIILEQGPIARTSYFQQGADSGNVAEWELLGYVVETKLEDYGIGWWYEISYYIALQRKPFYYVITLTVPSFFITDLAIIGVFSPSSASQERQEKVSIGLTALLTMAVILMMVSELMPKNAAAFPQLGKFILFEMAIMGCSTVVAVLIMYLASQGTFGRRVPTWLLFSAKLRKRRKADKLKVHSYDYTPHYQPIAVRTSTFKAEMYVQMYQMTQLVKNIQTHLMQLETDQQEQLEIQKEWTHLCYQLDILALVVTICINTYVTYLFSLQ